MDAVLFWIIAAFLAVIVTLAVLWPMLRRRNVALPSRAEYDAEVYGAQLAELKADVERGTMPAAEAATARAEIGRRLLKATSESAAATASPAAVRRVTVVASILFVAAAIPVASFVFYGRYGSPDMPDRPLEARLAVDPAKADLPTLVAQAEARLRERPDDGAGWEMLAPIYLQSGRPDEAATAFGNAIRLLGPTPDRETGLGEAETQAAAGEVTDVAKASFERALTLNPDYLPAKFFLALDASQEGRFAEAGPAWQELIDRSPEGAPWLELARMGVKDANEKLAAATAGALTAPATAAAVAPPRGPTGADVAAAKDMSGEDRQAMIEGMVSQLAERLKTAPNDVEGWKRLIKSYSVLGDADRAKAAFADASAAFSAGSPERAEIERVAAGLGLSPGAGTAEGETRPEGTKLEGTTGP